MPTTSAPLIRWDATYSVNIAILDAQHKNLVSTVNELYKAMLEGRSKDHLGQILSSLVSYTQEHFAAEEKLMLQYRYPDFNVHKAEHDRLTGTVVEFQRRFLSSEVGLSIELLDFLRDWLAKHILGSDRRYSPFLTAKGVH